MNGGVLYYFRSSTSIRYQPYGAVVGFCFVFSLSALHEPKSLSLQPSAKERVHHHVMVDRKVASNLLVPDLEVKNHPLRGRNVSLNTKNRNPSAPGVRLGCLQRSPRGQ